MELKGYQRSYLTKHAHDIKPVVMIGRNGMSDQIIKAVEEALRAHELIKVKFVEHKEDRKTLANEMAEATHAELVRIIGNIAVLYKVAYDPDNRKISVPA